MPTFQSNGITLSYTDTGGDGRPVLLVHGWPLSGASWSEQVNPLHERGYRVLTYDRRGFGESEKPESGYDYDTLTDDLAGLVEGLGLAEVTLVGFSMGGGEVARYLGTQGRERLRSVVFAGAVPPYLLKTEDNPEGGLEDSAVTGMQDAVRADRDGFLDEFMTTFFSADGELAVTEEQRRQALELTRPARDEAVLGCIDAFGRTDFRDDLLTDTVPTLVLHGDSDAIVPLEVSGARTVRSVPGAHLHVVKGGPHGFNVSHAEESNRELLEFLKH